MNSKIPLSVFKLMADHIGHDVKLVGYGKNAKPPWANLAVECMDCDCLIADWSPKDPPRRKRKKAN